MLGDNKPASNNVLGPGNFSFVNLAVKNFGSVNLDITLGWFLNAICACEELKSYP